MGSTRWWLAGAVVAAMCAAATGCSSSGRAAPPKAASLASVSWDACTEQVTLTSRVGQMRACVDYHYAHGRLKVLATAASYASSSGYDLPNFTFAFRDPSRAVIEYKFSSAVVQANGVFSHNTGLIDLGKRAERRDIQAGDVLQVSLWAINAGSGRRDQMASVALTLYPRGLFCPDMGADAGYDEATGQC
ncbi:MAG TPA: hypothetical protein VME44_19040 [Streptosporangiaceae bacterium]|nr:hypothetical protein [Streptosporangiaceae bacterium]